MEKDHGSCEFNHLADSADEQEIKPIRADIDIVADFERGSERLAKTEPDLVDEIRKRQRAVADKKDPPNSDVWDMRLH